MQEERGHVGTQQRGSWTYLHIVGQLRGHQLVELLLAQGAGGAVLPGVRLELGDQGADGGLHGDFDSTKITGTKKRDEAKSWKAAAGREECRGLTCRVMLCDVSPCSVDTAYIHTRHL